MRIVQNLIADMENEKFLVTSRSSIVSTLRELMKKEGFITVVPANEDDELYNDEYHDNDENDTYINVRIIYVNPDKDYLVFEQTGGAGRTRQMLECHDILFDNKQSSVIIQFEGPKFTPVRFNGQPAIMTPIPKRLMRLQRREFYRIEFVETDGAKCTFTVDGKEINLPVEDISLGGVSIIDPEKKIPFEAGQVYQNCLINVPSFGLVQANLQVKNVREKKLESTGRMVSFVGFQFNNLPNTNIMQLQRVITQMQLKKKSID